MEFRNNIQQEALETALEFNRCGLNISVRLGKTKIGLNIASNFKKVLVSYPSISILSSWKNDAEKFKIDINHIDFTTHLSLNKYELNKYSCIILDEVDQVSEAQWEFIASQKPKVIKALSGTFPTSGIKKKFIEEYCPIKYTIKLDDTIGKTSKDYEIIVHLLQPSIKQDIPLKSGKFWSEKSKIQFWENKYNKSRNFMDMLKLIQSIQNSSTKLNYLKKLSDKIDRCLIFLETTKQCDDLPYYSYHSKIKVAEDNLKAFQEGKINKLNCVKQLSAGISFPMLNECIILHAYASNNKTHQRLARCLQYTNEEKAKIHILCLDNTRDVSWVQSGLAEFDKNKIHFIKV